MTSGSGDSSQPENTLALILEGHPREAAAQLEQTLHQGELPRGEAGCIPRLKERRARARLAALTADGILGSDTPKGAVSLRFRLDAAEVLFPGLFPQA
jgi:hypothetical protein